MIPPSQIPNGKKSGPLGWRGFLLMSSGVTNARMRMVATIQLKNPPGCPLPCHRQRCPFPVPIMLHAGGKRFEGEIKERGQHCRQADEPEAVRFGLSPWAKNQPRHSTRAYDGDRPEQWHRPGQHIKQFCACFLCNNIWPERQSSFGVESTASSPSSR